MNYVRLFILMFLFFPNPSQQQQPADDYRSSYRMANQYYEDEQPTSESDSLALTYFEITIRSVERNPLLSKIWLDCFIKSGNIFQGQQKFEQAVPYYQAVLQKATHEKDTLFLYQSCLYLGSARYSLFEIDSARSYFEQASRYAEGKTTYPDLSILYNSLGIIYFEAANFRQAINYFQLAADRLPSSDESYTESMVSFKNNIAGCYARLGQNETALHLYHTLLASKQLGEQLYQNLGHVYYNLKNYDSSLYYFNKVTASTSATYARLLNDKARIFMQLGNTETAEQIFDEAIALQKQLPGHGKNKDKAYSYLYRSQLAEQQGLIQEAIGWSNIALAELHYNFNPGTSLDLPANETDVISPITFFEALQYKARLLHSTYKTSGNEKWLVASLRTNLMAVKTANYIKNNFDNDEAAFFFNENFEPLFKQAAMQTATLYESTGKASYLDTFLFITESYKGSILNRNLVLSRIKSTGILPDSLLQKENDLKQLLAVYTTRLNNTSSEENALLLRKRLTSIQIELSRLHRYFERFPAYTAVQNPNATLITSANSIQQRLPAATAAFLYFWSDSVLLCLAIHPKEAKLLQIPVTNSFRAQIRSYLSSLYEAKEGVRYEGYSLAETLYRQLTYEFPSSFFRMKRWVILPDGLFNYLPFETLLTRSEPRTFLVEDRILSYHYSFTLLFSHPFVRQSYENTLAMAPFSQSTATIEKTVFPALPFSGKEVKGHSVVLEDSSATRMRFLKEAADKTLIHLATHARAFENKSSNQETFIQMYHHANAAPENSRIYLHEIYNLRLQQHPLILLSACETASGFLSGSEGLLSLARGFFYAGSRGIISSLWKANDQATSYLMERVQFYLRKHFNADEALQKARVDFLQDKTVDVRLKAPSYWGNFIYLGQTKEVSGEFNPGDLVILLLILVLLLLAFLYSKK